MPTALVLRAVGTNCEQEMIRAFELAGARAELCHIDRLIADPQSLDRYDLIGFPGGFSYGDDIASGRIFAMKLRERLWPALKRAIDRGVPMIGACNGFQVMVQVGLLPGTGFGSDSDLGSPGNLTAPAQTLALTDNIGGRFVDRWVGIDIDDESPCVWTRGLSEAFASGRNGHPSVDPANILQLPVAHGEGRLVGLQNDTIAQLAAAGQAPVRYRDNYNGSTLAVAGICDPTGRIFGLMPHPERYLDWNRHPSWTRLPAAARTGPTPGLMMFKNAVEAAVNVSA